jgi:hypothetical protein
VTTPEPRPRRPSTAGLWWVVTVAALGLLVAEASIMTGLVSDGVRTITGFDLNSHIVN